ncbi:ABC transporter substrate-binding protein [Pseudochelatococcus sp. B33]
MGAMSALLLASPAFAQDSKKLVVAATGGQYERILREHVFAPFTKETGIEVTFVAGALGERWGLLRAMADSSGVEWDLMEVGSGDVWVPGRNSLLLDLGNDCALVPKAKTDGFPDTCNRYGVLSGFGATLLVANEDLFKGPLPSDWKDFYDVENFPGPRALSNFGDPWRALVGALLADGVPANELFPLDLDRAFAKLDEIRPHIAVWWRTGDQIQRAFREKEVSLGLIWNTRTEFLRNEGVPLKRIWDGATLNMAHWSIFKDAPNKENAIRFLNWYFDNPEAQVAYGRAAAISPSTRSALALYSPEEQKEQPTYQENLPGIVSIDYEWLGQNNDTILKRWNTWIAR